MAKIKLPPTFAARVKSVHHPAPPPTLKPIAVSTSALPPGPQKAPNPGMAVAVTRGRKWNHKVSKYFLFPKHVYVSDPTAAVRAGDTIMCTWWPSLSRSKRTTHTVTEVIKAYGADVGSRANVWTEEERRAWRRDTLLREGTENTKKGLLDGTVVIGEHGQVVELNKKRRGGRSVEVEREGETDVTEQGSVDTVRRELVRETFP